MTLSAQEKKYILYVGIFSLVWFPFLMPKMMQSFSSSSPLSLFLIFNLSIYAFLFIFLKAFSLGTAEDLKASIALLALFVGLDIVMPEYHVAMDGSLIGGATLAQSTSDYVIGYTLQGFGLQGFPIFLLTYVVFPMGLLYLAALFLPNFVRRV